MKRISETEHVSLVEKEEVVTFRWEDGTTADVPRDVVAKSKLLQSTLSDVTPGDEVKFSLPRGMLQHWISGVSEQPYLLKMLEAASSLGDLKSLKSVGAQVAEWLFQGDCAQVIAQLPSNVVEATLRATSMHLELQLLYLPECLHAAAVHAAFPSIQQHGRMDSDCCLALLLPQLPAITQLTELRIKDDQLGDSEAEVVLRNLGDVTSLQRLSLASSSLGSSGYNVKNFIPVLKRLPLLQELDLSEATLGGPAVHALASGLSNLTALRHFALSIAPIPYPGGHEKLMCSIANACTSLKSLDLIHCSINASNMGVLVTHLPKISTLKRLALGDNDLGCEGLRALGPGVANLPSLEVLRLPFVRGSCTCCYTASSSCIVDLATHLVHCTKLRGLDLMFNFIWWHDIVPLMNQLSRLVCLQRLELADDSVSNHGIQAAIPHFMPLTNLQMLSLYTLDSIEPNMHVLRPLVDNLPLLKVPILTDCKRASLAADKLFRFPFNAWKLPCEMAEDEMQ